MVEELCIEGVFIVSSHRSCELSKLRLVLRQCQQLARPHQKVRDIFRPREAAQPITLPHSEC